MSAGNVFTPAYLTLKDLGYELSIEGKIWSANNGKIYVSGYSPMELLGMISIREIRGDDWMASDDEIKDFLERFIRKKSKH